MTPLFYVAALLYAAASLLFLVYLFGRGEERLRQARWLLCAALVAHLAMIGALCTRGLNPLRDLRGALSLSAWLLGVGYLGATMRGRLAALGAFIAPLSLALLASARLTPQSTPAAGTASGLGHLGELHLALVALGVAAFGLAAAVAGVYLLQETALKRKRLGTLFRRSPPLAALDQAGRTLVLVGFPVYTLAVGTGVIWLARLPGHSGLRPEHALAGITWMLFALVIVARWTVGWRGRSAAWATVAGFLATVLVLLLYFGRRVFGG